ncbi:MAG: hypothetical protein KKF98_02970 [Bacteroidetes bacterium]|nr:hypothetical protein [Bacteroidota bacterium]
MTTFALCPTNSNITRRMNSDRDIAAELQTPLRGGMLIVSVYDQMGNPNPHCSTFPSPHEPTLCPKA